MISIIIVSFNTKNLLHACLQSLSENPMASLYEIIIVDNHSTDGTKEMLAHEFSSLTVIANEKNEGFSKANNQAAEISKGDYLLFLNSDTVINGSSIEKLHDYLKNSPQAGIVGPKIVGPTGVPTRSYMRFLTINMFWGGSKLFAPFMDIKKNRMHYPHYDFTTTRDVPWLSGACMMIKRSVFQQVGGFDEHYFFYCEDMDLCLQVHRLGYKIVYLPSAEMIHLFSGSSTKEIHKLSAIHKQSLIYYIKKNHSVVHSLIARFYYYF